jgi:TldD protein
MVLRIDTNLLRRILAASLPAGVRSAELFIESRLILGVGIKPEVGGGVAVHVERRWETGAHLRRFSERGHESFVLDAPSPESLEALALHPEAVEVSWFARNAPLGIERAFPADSAQAVMADAAPSDSDGPWSSAFLVSSRSLLEEWLGAFAAGAAGSGMDVQLSANLEAGVQEILVLATDRDPARDTRTFVDATLRAQVERGGRRFLAEETRSGASLEALGRLASAGPGSSRTKEHPAMALAARLRRGLEAVSSPRGEMPVVFASPSGGFLLHEICGHLLEADHVLRGASPFVGARGRAIASPLLNMADDGSIAGMRGSALFDDEGVAARRTPLVIKGTLVGYLSDRLTAFATDGISTGNGRRQSYRDAPMPRMTNLVIDPGEESFDEILKRTATGLLVTRLGRGNVDPATGRFALAVEEGFLIEDGRAGAPVAGALLRGTAADLLPAIDAVGCDASTDTGSPLCLKEEQALPFGILQPTLRVSSMMVTEAGP